MSNLRLSPLSIAFVTICLLAFVIGFILYFQSDEQTQQQSIGDTETQFSYQSGEWKSIIEGIKQFSPIKTDNLLNDQLSANEEKSTDDTLVIGKESRITLLGLLKNENNIAIIKNSWIDDKQEQHDSVLRLNIGESTPDGWKLVNIQGDLSIWLNEQSEESLNLALFDSHNKKQTEVNK